MWAAFGGEVLWFLLLVTVDQEVSDGLGSASSLVRFSPLVLGVQLGGGKVVRLGGVEGWEEEWVVGAEPARLSNLFEPVGYRLEGAEELAEEEEEEEEEEEAMI